MRFKLRRCVERRGQRQPQANAPRAHESPGDAADAKKLASRRTNDRDVGDRAAAGTQKRKCRAVKIGASFPGDMRACASAPTTLVNFATTSNEVFDESA